MTLLNEKLNLYGDRLVSTTGAHGADIGSQRIDDLDKQALTHLLTLDEIRISSIDLGCGFGWQGARFSMLGAAAYLFDLLPPSHLVKSLCTQQPPELYYSSCDLRRLRASDLPEKVQLAFSQRFIHYLTYPEALRLIQTVGERMPAGARFYISASGLDSELGNGYKDREKEISGRFTTLSAPMQTKHDIAEAVCLYNKAELTQLMVAGGFVECKIWESTFGNIKGVFEKSS
jgi:hypothetical protein